MTEYNLMRRAVRLWTVKHVPRETCRANAIKWLISVKRLGDKWLVGQARTKEQLMKGQQ
jgi:hypothetical protein